MIDVESKTLGKSGQNFILKHCCCDAKTIKNFKNTFLSLYHLISLPTYAQGYNWSFYGGREPFIITIRCLQLTSR